MTRRSLLRALASLPFVAGLLRLGGQTPNVRPLSEATVRVTVMSADGQTTLTYVTKDMRTRVGQVVRVSLGQEKLLSGVVRELDYPVMVSE